MKLIYGVFAIHLDGKRSHYYCEAYFSTLKKAKRYLYSNVDWIYDYYHHYVVIGEVELNAPAISQFGKGYKGTWYKFKHTMLESSNTIHKTRIVKLKSPPKSRDNFMVDNSCWLG